MATAGVRWTHRNDDTISIYTEGTLDVRNYDLDNHLFYIPGLEDPIRLPDRDSIGVRANLGWQKQFGDTIDL